MLQIRNDKLPVRRTRAAIVLVSMAVIALELALMRLLSIRFWSHFAYMVISVAILGFAASGTCLTLVRRWVIGRYRVWMHHLALGFALSIPLIALAAKLLPLDVPFLAWDLSQGLYVAALEALMFVPFFFSGMFIGIALMDEPGRISGHYGANLLGSGLGALAAVAAMTIVPSHALILCASLVALAGGALLVPPRRSSIVVTVLVGACTVVLAVPPIQRPVVSQYKMLPQTLNTPGSEVIHRSEGPLGRIDVVTGPGIHYAPGLSLQYTGPVPPHALLIVDGDQTSAVYDCKKRNDYAFADHTTSALAYHLRERPSVCILGAGGGVDIGLASYHNARGIVALEMNRQVIEAMTGPLADRGGDVFTLPQVRVLLREGREYLTGASEQFEVIQLPPLDAFGASGAGLHASQESYLYTVEALSQMIDRLSERGVLSVTRWVRNPPRDALKIFETARQALHRKNLRPEKHLAMIRSWATATVLVFREAIGEEDSQRIRTFCEVRGFDLCYLPDLGQDEANKFHVLDRPHYFEACAALLGERREEYLREYLFNVVAATDDKPYFFHFLTPRSLPILREQLGRRSRAYAEVGTLMLVGAMLQAAVMGTVFILLPLAPGVAALRVARGRAVTLGYFLAIGVAFMLLEISFLQRFIRYLGDPIYSAGVVISGFLVFAGVGSLISGYWSIRPQRLCAIAGTCVGLLVVGYLVGMDRWLGVTQGAATPIRFAIALVTIAPLGIAMGHMFPAGMRAVSSSVAALVPWAWAVNGFASVLAAVSTPLLAMNFGFANVTLLALAFYLLAAVLGLLLPKAT